MTTSGTVSYGPPVWPLTPRAAPEKSRSARNVAGLCRKCITGCSEEDEGIPEQLDIGEELGALVLGKNGVDWIESEAKGMI